MTVRKSIGYLPEIPPVYPELTVSEYLRFVAKLKKIPKADLQSEIDRVIERLSLESVHRRLIRNLSKGYQQRTGFAQALLGNPPVLILDEPTVGLDPRQIGEVRVLIKELSGAHTVILSTHILQVVVATCERVVIINRGQIVADNTLANLVAEHADKSSAQSLEQIFLSLTEV